MGAEGEMASPLLPATANEFSINIKICPQLLIDKMGIITLSFLCCYKDKHIKIHYVF